MLFSILFFLGCCIYEKPRNFDESSSEEDSDDECEHCKGHVEKKKKKKPTDEDPINSVH